MYCCGGEKTTNEVSGRPDRRGRGNASVREREYNEFSWKVLIRWLVNVVIVENSNVYRQTQVS